jgi:hypothetical protein
MSWVTIQTGRDFERGAVYAFPSGRFFKVKDAKTVHHIVVHQVSMVTGMPVYGGEAWATVGFLSQYARLCWTAAQWKRRAAELQADAWAKAHPSSHSQAQFEALVHD